MNSADRERVMGLKRHIALLNKQLSTAIDKQLLLMNQVIDLKAENERLRNQLADQYRDLSHEYAQRTKHLEQQLHETIKHTTDLLATGMPAPRIVVSGDVADQWRTEGFEDWRKRQ